MKRKAPHKFQAKMETTYEQYFRDQFQYAVELAKTFEQVLGKDKTFKIIGKWAEEHSVKSLKSQTKKPIKDFKDFKAVAKKKSPFTTHVLTLTYPEETPSKLSCCITECLWAKTFKEMNATDLGYIMICHPDFAVARAFHPKIRLKRTKTLMQGDSYCNHTFRWKE